MPTAQLFGALYALNPPALLLLAAAAITVAMAWHGRKLRRFPGRQRFIAMQLGAAAWALSGALENMAQDPALKVLWAEIAWGGIVAAPTAWAMFVWSYGRGEEKLLPGRWVWLPWVMPVLTLGVALTNGLHGLMYRGTVPISDAPGAAINYHHGAWYFLTVVYLYGFMLFSVFAIIEAIHRSHGLYRRHYLGMAFAMMLPWAANLAYVTGTFTLFDFDPTPFSFLAMGGIFHWMIHRRHLFEVVPIARTVMLDSLPDPVLVLDVNGMVLEANRAACDLAGMANLGGRRFQDLDWAGQELGRVLSTPGDALAELPLGAGGRHFEVRRVDLDRDGQMMGMLLMFRDVTHRREAEERLRATLEDLRRAKSEAEAASRAKSEFLAVMSHEIRTPMNGVAAMAELLAQTRTDSEQGSMVSILRQSAESMLTIIDDILDFSKIEAGRLVVEQVAFAPVRVIEDVAQMIAARAAEKGIEVVVDAAALPAQMRGDPARLRQVLLNLAGNAVKFTERGHVLLRAWTEDAVLNFAVTDTGIGIAPDQHAHLFQPFTQADGSVARRYGGTGLGLSICKRLLDLMGGHIWLSSAPGRGSTFCFTLPALAETETAPRPRPLDGLRVAVRLHEPLGPALERLVAAHGAEVAAGSADVVIVEDGAATTTAPQVTLVPFDHLEAIPADGAWLRKPVRAEDLIRAVAVATGRQSAGQGSARPGETAYAAPSAETADAEGTRLLVAEDSPVNRMVVSKMLDRLGMVYDLARDGDEALSLFRQHRYGLVLTDLHMPGMDGVTLARAIRAGRSAEELPILALTADVMAQTARLCAEAGMQGCLTKPVPLAQLDEILIRHLPRAAQLRRALAEQPAALPPPRPATPILDSAHLSELFGGLNGEALALLDDFRTNAQTRLASLVAALAEGDAAAARRHAHTARGTARSVGAGALAEVFATLDDCLSEGDLALADRLVHQAVRQLDVFREYLAELKARPDATRGNA